MSFEEGKDVHKEESLISSQFLKNQRKSKTSLFSDFVFNPNSSYYKEFMLFICHDKKTY